MAVKGISAMLAGGTLTDVSFVPAGGGFPDRIVQQGSFPGTADYAFTFTSGLYPNGATLHSVIFPGVLGRSNASGDDQRKIRAFYDLDGGGFVEVDPGDFDLNVSVPPDGVVTIRAQFEDDALFDSSIDAWVSEEPSVLIDNKADVVPIVSSVGIGGRFLG